MTTSEQTIKANNQERVTDNDLLQLSRGLFSAASNGAGIVEIDAKTALLLVKELMQRRAEQEQRGGQAQALSGEELTERVGAYVHENKGEWVSEIAIATSLGMENSPRSLRLIRQVLRDLGMAYVGMDNWREPID